MEPTGIFAKDIELIVQNVARFFAREGNAKLVSLLVDADVHADCVEHDNWNGGTDVYEIEITVNSDVFMAIEQDKDEIEKVISNKIGIFMKGYENTWQRGVSIRPKLYHVEDWREKARDWVKGIGVNNQGRVRSNNVANRQCDGLLFRSQPEIYFYQAMKEIGMTFAPLPVFLQGGLTYARIEPDFIIVKNGISMCVEIDGDTVHTETPAEANARTRLLSNEGILVERFKSSECDTLERARLLAKKVADLINLHKRNRA